ncbi:MAG: pullulanase-type alpha-1,6-glucosidase [Candidatus Sericytochromatia bacterium]
MKKSVLPVVLSLFLISGCAGQVAKKYDSSKDFKKSRKYVDNARARWISTDSIVLPFKEDPKDYTFHLYYSQFGNISIARSEIVGGESIRLETSGFFSEKEPNFDKYSYLKGQLKISTSKINKERIIPELLRGNLLLVIRDKSGKLYDATQLQTYGILDQLYTYEGDDLGVSYNRYHQPILKLWAPTAKSVKIYFYDNPTDKKPSKVREMEEVVGQGIWKIQGTDSWIGKYYLYDVEVYSPISGNLENNIVTDPYSISLSANGEKSQIIDFDDDKLKPYGWDNLEKPQLKSFNDISIYELHVRDFSIKDKTVSEQNRGKFLAFTEKESQGMNHLLNLADSGLTHIHLLPIADMSSVEENEVLRKEANIQNIQGSSSIPQQIVGSVRKRDGYNWGYDPMHFSTPEGSYSTNPNGSDRILELRRAVKSLSDKGLRVIMDVVYNHTASSGIDKNSVLDKVVPAYYYRLSSDGKIQNTSCCPDTATEHNMMEKLMVDSIKMWAKEYKIDGFRFDLMGHHTKDNIKKVRQVLDSLTLQRDGVDGKKIYLYGEGWKFGSLNDILPNKAMNQQNSSGTGIGTFNDRFRDSVRGGNFTAKTLTDQGFIDGLYYDYNDIYLDGNVSPVPSEQKEMLFNLEDNIKLGLVGNLKNYKLKTNNGLLKGSEVSYQGAEGSAYTSNPQENISYVSAHDNHTLWDLITAKAPYNVSVRVANNSRDTEGVRTASTSEKVRMQNMALSLVSLSQGIPFFNAGDDMLRSKSGDGDSYDSGDWFNALDFSYSTNNWGIGLPPEWRNKNEWNFWQPRLANSKLKPTRDEILNSVSHLQRMLRIRKSSPLFRFKTEKDIIDNISFLDNESFDKNENKYISNKIPAVIGMNIDDKSDIDPLRKSIFVLFNASNENITFTNRLLKDRNLVIHQDLANNLNTYIENKKVSFSPDPMLKNSMYNKSMGSITVPARTTVVYQEF